MVIELLLKDEGSFTKMKKGFVIMTSTKRTVVACLRVDKPVILFASLQRVFWPGNEHSRLPGRPIPLAGQAGSKLSLKTQNDPLSRTSHVLGSHCVRTIANPY